MNPLIPRQLITISALLGHLMLTAGPIAHAAETQTADKKPAAQDEPAASRMTFESIYKLAEDGHAEAQNYVGDCAVYGIEGQNQDFERAASWYRKAAVRGLATSQFNLALLYESGRGVSTNLTLALEWYRKAADQGQPDAQSALGLAALRGKGTLTNLSDAAKWFEAAALSNHAEATYFLGVMYRDGLGKTKNVEKAGALFEQAALRAHPEAQLAFAETLLSSPGLEKRREEALSWASKATTANLPAALYLLGSFHETGSYTNKALNLAEEWFRRSAELGHPGAQAKLGSLMAARGNKSEIPEALFWLRASAEAGNPQGQYGLAKLLKDQNQEPLIKESLMWARKAADQNHADAHHLLGSAYMNDSLESPRSEAALKEFSRGETLGSAACAYALCLAYSENKVSPQDLPMAFRMASSAAQLGHTDAMAWLGHAYETGQGAPVDGSQSLKWRLNAAERGHTEARAAAGRMLAQGRVVPADIPKAKRLLERAATEGSAEAQLSLGNCYLGHSEPTDKAANTAITHWLSLAASQGSAEAQVLLGHLHAQGQRVAKDLEQAAAWWQKAADQSHPEALLLLAECYERGIGGIPKDPGLARAALARSATSGFKPALRKAATRATSLYDKYHWLTLATDQGDDDSRSALAELKTKVSQTQWAELEQELTRRRDLTQSVR